MVGEMRYRRYYWCIKTEPGISKNGEVMLMADELCVDTTGNLLCKGHHSNEASASLLLVAFAAGQWKVFYTASLLDGQPVSVDHWLGEEE